MKADAKAQWNVWEVGHDEGSTPTEDFERDHCDLGRMVVFVVDRQPRCHHVGVTNRLNLD